MRDEINSELGERLMLASEHRVASKDDASANGAAVSTERRWYVVHTQPHRESCAQSHLADQGFAVFLPRFVKNVRHARQVRTVVAPLFPRYLFVALYPDRQRWRSINGTHGVTSILTQDDRPCPVPAGVVEALAERCDAGQIMRAPDLRPGQAVRIVAGPFAEQLGAIERLAGAERVRVLLGLMGCSVAVKLDRSAIMPLQTF